MSDNLKIAEKIIFGSEEIKKLSITKKLKETKKSFYNYLDEAKRLLDNQIKTQTELEKNARKEEYELRKENRPKYEIETMKHTKNNANQEKQRLKQTKRREVFDLKRFIRTGDLNRYINIGKNRTKNKPIKFNLVKSALEKSVEVYEAESNNEINLEEFLEEARYFVLELIREKFINYKVRLCLHCEMVKINPATGEETTDKAYFHSKQEIILKGTNLNKVYDRMIEKIKESFSQFQKKGSGWQHKHVMKLEVIGSKFDPLKGSSYVETPKWIANKNAIINIKSTDQECFKWAVTCALFTNGDTRHPNRITKFLKEKSKTLNFEGVEFLTQITDKNTPFIGVERFERQNPGCTINIIGHEKNLFYPLRVSKQYANITLLLLQDKHFTVVKNLSRLLSRQLSKHGHAKFICVDCFNYFGKQRLLDKHVDYCSTHDVARVVMPEKGAIKEFKNYQHMIQVPFKIYADFECFTKPIENNLGKCTKQYQKHEPSGFCYLVKCFDDSVYRPKLVHYTKTTEDEDIAQIFIDKFESEIKEIYKRFRFSKRMILTDVDKQDFEQATCCFVCNEELFDDNKVEDKVRDHCHFTGNYRGAAHSQCNLKLKRPKHFPVILHNLENYDSHLFITKLGVSEGEINCIAKTEERYISFTKEVIVDTFRPKEKPNELVKVKRQLRFIDSFKFMSSGLSDLVNNLDKSNLSSLKYFYPDHSDLLSRKGVYPYDYMDSLDKLKETKLPLKSMFYSKLNDQDISDEDYAHTQNVWNTFQMSSMRDYHDLYLKTDPLLLCDVFEKFIKTCLQHYKLDPLWYYTAPGLSWDSMLKFTKVKIELLSDQDMYLMFEKGVRGGVSMITKRHAKANNKYLDDYDSEKLSTYIPYLDANNLYGCALMNKLPLRNFKWMSEKELLNWRRYSCILEVDFEYSESLHDHHDYPLAPEKVKSEQTGVEKLTPNLTNKTKYVVHHSLLKSIH